MIIQRPGSKVLAIPVDLGLRVIQPRAAAVAWVPSDLAGLVLWLDADVITSLSDGDPVGTWSDQSGNGNDVTQATTAKKPTYKTSIINSLPVVRFDGTDDGLVLADNLSTATEGTIFVVLQLTAVLADWQTPVTSSDEAAATRFWFCRAYHDASSPYIRIRQRNDDAADTIDGSTTITAGAVYLQVWQSSGAAYSLRVNGNDETEVVDAGTNSGDWLGDTADRDNFVVGMAKRSSEGAWLKGDIGEVIVYDTSLSAGDLGDVETYLNNKWSIY